MTINVIKYTSHLLVCLLLVIGLQSCSANGPKPIKYGKDQCVYCKMTISDARFGTQLLTKKGRAYNFDDVSCMVAFSKEGQVAPEEIANLYVPDYHTKKLYPVTALFFLKSEQLKSPMRGDIAAFKNESDLKHMQEKLGGEQLSWEQISK